MRQEIVCFLEHSHEGRPTLCTYTLQPYIGRGSMFTRVCRGELHSPDLGREEGPILPMWVERRSSVIQVGVGMKVLFLPMLVRTRLP
jgi:hypothetical protein